MIVNPDKQYVTIGYYTNIHGERCTIGTQPFKGSIGYLKNVNKTELEDLGKFMLSVWTVKMADIDTIEVYELNDPILML